MDKKKKSVLCCVIHKHPATWKPSDLRVQKKLNIVTFTLQRSQNKR